MAYMEITADKAVEFLKKSKGEIVLVAVYDFGKNDVALFRPKFKSVCLSMIEEAETIGAICSDADFVRQLNLFSEKQDIHNIKNFGIQRVILLNEQE